jgi:hypothetical protein
VSVQRWKILFVIVNRMWFNRTKRLLGFCVALVFIARKSALQPLRSINQSAQGGQRPNTPRHTPAVRNRINKYKKTTQYTQTGEQEYEHRIPFGIA